MSRDNKQATLTVSREGGRRSRSLGGLVIGLMAVALMARLWGLGFSLPYSTYADEPVVVLYALQDGARLVGQTPARPSYPQAYTSILLFCYGVYYLVGRVLGEFQAVADLVTQYVTNPTSLFIIGRAVSALTGAVAVPLIYGSGIRLFDRPAAFLAAALIAFNYYLVYYGHLAVVDSMLIMTACLALWFIVRIYQSEHGGNYAAAGFSIGLGIATKLTPTVLVFSLLAAHFMRPSTSVRAVFHRLFDKRLGLAVLAIGVGVAVFWPDLFLDATRFRQGLGGYSVGRMSFDLSNLWQLVAYSPPYWAQTAAEPVSIMIQSLRLMGDGMLVLALIGVVYCLSVFPRQSLVILAGPLALYVGLGVTGYPILRQISLVVPFLMLTEAVFIIDVGRRLSRRFPFARNIIVAGLCVVALAQPVAMVAQLDYLLSRPGTLPVAAAWMREHIPPGSKIALDPMYTPYSQFTDAALAGGDGSGTNMLRGAYAQNAPDYELFSTVDIRADEKVDSLFSRLVERKVEYVIVADYYYRRFYEGAVLPLGSPERIVWEQRRALYDDLESRATLAVVFEPKVLHGIGPLIKVYYMGRDKATGP